MSDNHEVQQLTNPKVVLRQTLIGENEISWIGFSPDGRILVTENKVLRLFDTKTGLLKAKLMKTNGNLRIAQVGRAHPDRINLRKPALQTVIMPVDCIIQPSHPRPLTARKAPSKHIPSGGAHRFFWLRSRPTYSRSSHHHIPQQHRVLLSGSRQHPPVGAERDRIAPAD